MNKKEPTYAIPNITNFAFAKVSYDCDCSKDPVNFKLYFDPIIAWGVYCNTQDQDGTAYPIGLEDEEIGIDCLIFDTKSKKWHFPHGDQGEGEESALAYLKENVLDQIEKEKNLRKRGCIK